ncbi:unnamed protein product [Prorocentrum cordatum]|uniref:Uncharacterized protein n=1 Tax=Prorocentrum cordatum TaxID=2364126 RepID=A0ABN9PU12_9DINO|nr:unnamed protein product [Polarella glacialis]
MALFVPVGWCGSRPRLRNWRPWTPKFAMSPSLLMLFVRGLSRVLNALRSWPAVGSCFWRLDMRRDVPPALFSMRPAAETLPVSVFAGGCMSGFIFDDLVRIAASLEKWFRKWLMVAAFRKVVQEVASVVFQRLRVARPG